VLAGEHAAGLDELQGGVAAWIATGAAILRPWHACLLSAALLLCREPDAALLAVDDGLAAVAGGERWCEPELHRCRAQGLQALGRRSRANASAQVAVVCARKLGSPAWERRALGTLAGLGDMSRAA
jgi:hypothetical protein